MKLVRRSLSEDSVDRYNHLWSVVLLLILSLITWLLPFSPAFSSLVENSRSTQSPAGEVLKAMNQRLQPEPPTYKAACWVPAQYTGAHVDYANGVCASFVNSVYPGDGENVSVYRVPEDPDTPIDEPQQLVPFQPKRKEQTSQGSSTSKPETRRVGGDDKTRTYLRKDTYFFTAVTVPLIMFIFAIFLKLPHVLWCLMSGCGAIDVDQTLVTARGGLSLDTDSRERLNSDLCRAVSGAAKSSRCLGLSYLFFKLLLCVVVVGELTVLGSVLLPEVNQLKEKNDEFSKQNALISGLTFSPKTTSEAVYEYENDIVLLCQFKIRQFKLNIQTWSVQCLFHYDTYTAPEATVDPSAANENGTEPGRTQMGDLLLGYHALLTAVLAFLVILLVVNVLSLLSWSSRLCLGICRDVLTSGGSTLSMDLSFLLLMSKENGGPLVTQALGKSLEGESSSGSGTGKLTE
ncbi:pannexin 10 isoform X1 [Aplysia californica]|uniref:Pannexin 10 isoform X1 n=1 Tax=Aplysia californica TaxID=6500 RepID=A0ABM0ZWM4_APLCA|nr:pannexin 10 isoform X1 [Aplysia californica]